MPFEPFPVDVTAHFFQDLKTLLDRQRDAIEAITHIASPTYDNTLKPLQDLEEELSLFFTPLSHLNSVQNSEATQKAYEAALPLLSAFHSEWTQNVALFQNIQRISVEDEASNQVVTHTVRDFLLAGAGLGEAEKERMKTIDLRLDELGNAFAQNLLNATSTYEMILDDPADVANLPSGDLEAARIGGDDPHAYRFTLQAPSYLAYMTYGTNRTRREELYMAYHTRAPENGTIVDELLRLRDEKAKLLRYRSYAHYALQTRDAPDEESVLAFLNELADTALPQAKKELKTLQDFARRLDGIDNIAPWDTAYYGEKLKKSLFGFESALAKPYFEQNRVLKGLLEMVSELFGVQFRPVEVPVWDARVHVYDLYERDALVGRIYFDLEARSQKRGGAWMHDWETHHTDAKGHVHLPSVFVVASFPATRSSIPSLLRHEDVVTLFHEMGHAIHHLFGRASERSVSGVHGVAWDAIEFPSQFLENFAYETPILRRFAFHHETNEPIPDALVASIKDSKNFQAALGILRQVEFSLFDFQLHQRLHQGDQVLKLLANIRKKTALISPPEQGRFHHGFAHIFSGGYAAGYYSYKWAEVLSADAFFDSVNTSGEFEPSRALGYRQHILAQGGVRLMSELFFEWLGRKPSTNNLLKLYGIEI